MNTLKPAIHFLSFLAIAAVLFVSAFSAHAIETNGTIIVDGPDAGFAWSNQAGWVNFGATNGNIHITDSGITGYAWNENHGWINMAPSQGGVSVAANGALSGHAWGAGLGWINFSGVSINSSGKFVGQATGTLIGTLTFDCANCDVRTDYVPQDFRSPGGGGGGGGGTHYGCKDPNAINYDFFSRHNQELCEYAESPEERLVSSPFLAPISTSAGPETGGAGGGEIPEEEIPEQLFDIRFLLDRDIVPNISSLVSRVTFESFGRVTTPVEMIFSIIDKDGRELWKAFDTTTVQTSAVFVKRFVDAQELPPGSYTLRLQTLYNTDVRDTFESPFTITPKAVSSYWLLWLIGCLVFLILALFILLLLKRRRHTCRICRHRYEEREWTRVCEEWCSSHASYNPDIVSHSIREKTK